MRKKPTFRVLLIPEGAIDHVQKRLAGNIAAEIFREELAARGIVALERSRHVGRKYRVIQVPQRAFLLQRLAFENIEARAADLVGTERLDQRALIDHVATADIHD